MTVVDSDLASKARYSVDLVIPVCMVPTEVSDCVGAAAWVNVIVLNSLA